jgi:hypothetical protein
MTRLRKLIFLQVVLLFTSAAAFSSFPKSGVTHGPHSTQMQMSSTGEDSSMSKLKDALQKLELNNSDQAWVNYYKSEGADNNDMPVKNKDGMYEITTKEQHT